MADFTTRVPVETEKRGAYLHDRTNRPTVQRPPAREWLRRNLGLVLGIALALGFEALAFQTRAAWNVHRDWVVPVTTPFWVLGGIALGHLLARLRGEALAPGLALLVLGLALTGGNIALAIQTDGPRTSRDVLSILAGVSYGLAIAALVVALLVVEWRHPTHATEPQM
jgi:hypothetical protein